MNLENTFLIIRDTNRGDGDGVHSRNGTVGENGALLLRESDHRFAAEKALEKFKMAKVWTQSPPSTTSSQARSEWLDRSAMNRLVTTLNSSSLERLPEDVEEGTGSEAGGDGVVDDERKKQKLLRSLLQSEQGWDPEESSLRSCGFLVVELASMPYMVRQSNIARVVLIFVPSASRCYTKRSSTHLWVCTCLR